MDAERPVVHTRAVESSTSATSSNISSLNSSESPRPDSGCSSTTSRSETSDADIELRRLEDGVPPPECSTSTAVLPTTPTRNSSPGGRIIPGSAPQWPRHTLSGTGSRVREPVQRAAVQSSSHWLSNTIGIVSLAASLSSLIFLGVRTYKLEVSQAVNGALAACTSLIQVTTLPNRLGPALTAFQANVTTLEASSSECKKSIAQGVIDSPYYVGKRALRHTSLFLVELKHAEIYAFSSNFYRALSISKTFYLLFLASATIVLGAVLLAFARRRSRGGEPLQSLARNEVLITRSGDKGTEIVAAPGVRLIRHNPDHNYSPGHVRRRIRSLQPEDEHGPDEVVAWQAINSSSDTLVNPFTGSNPSKVSITDQPAIKKHEGSIELETTGDNKTSFEPKTDNFILLPHWRIPHKNDYKKNGDQLGKTTTKGNTMRAIARMATGLSALAGGPEVDNAIVDKITYAENRIVAQRAGDSLAGLVTNERPSGRPQLV